MNAMPGTLSGGERQRAAIAQQPRVLLCDEPTGNLDRRTAGVTTDLLLVSLGAEGLTMIVVTHDEQVAARLPARLAVEDGRITRQRPVTASPAGPL
jgi:predicted ABC-type transport system involved in lysophospholipase L1 biosynthesis ATPase subunit